MYIICWLINGWKGQGKPLSQRDAHAWRKKGDEKWGPGTHWVIPVE